MSSENRRVSLKNNSHAGDTVVETVELRVVGAATSNSIVHAAGKFVANATATTANVGVVAGLIGRTTVQGLTSVPNGITAALWGQMEVSGGANVASANGAYALVLDSLVDTGIRGAGATPTAFIGFGEEAVAAGNSTVSSSPVLYLFDIGRPGMNVVSVANSTVNSVYTTASATTNSTAIVSANGSLRIRVNGNVKFIPLVDSVT